MSRHAKDANGIGTPTEDLQGEGHMREQAQLSFE